MAKKKATVTDVTRILPGTPEMESFLSPAYGMTVEQAKEIIKERESNPASHPYEEYRNAKAFMAAYNSTASVISKTPGGKFFSHSAKEE
ncbi:MAG: hypothetical protein WC373_06710 [Smithella sp.]|jgi:hypothetical protein